MARFNTDKEEPHGYLPDYLALAADIGPAGVVCEIGVHGGGSLAMWQELFPDGRVLGVDRDAGSTWPPGTVKIVADQAEVELGKKVREHAPDGCDLIVDDASHIGSWSAATFGSLWPLVRPGGYYVIEDWADPWVMPEWGVAAREDRLAEWVAELIKALMNGAARVTYTYEGLAIVQRQPEGFLTIAQRSPA